MKQRITDRCSQFLATKVVKEIYNSAPTEMQTQEINDFFSEHQYVKERDNFKRYAHWLQQGKTNWAELNSRLKQYQRRSIEYYQILYGTDPGKERFDLFRSRAYSTFTNTVSYWLKEGKTLEDAKQLVSDIQASRNAKKTEHRTSSVRCIEYWVARGYSEAEAVNCVSRAQSRDKSFFIKKYGNTEGENRYFKSVESRKSAWQSKDKVSHAFKTTPKAFNVAGQEMQAVSMFIEQNELHRYKLLYGSPAAQYTVNIPDHGVRRYDLAVFDQGILKIIFEFHGIGHVNFSEYDPLNKDNKMSFKGVQLSHLGFYGKTCYNDYIKKSYIEQTFPDVIYCVAWTHNLTIKDLKIDSIKCKRNDELSFSILPDGNVKANT